MEIIVKKDILDELQAKGVCYSRDESNIFLQKVIDEIATGMASKKKVYLEYFGYFSITKNKEHSDDDILESVHLVENITKNTEMDKERADGALRMLFHFVKEMIIKGYEVQIIDFASFRIEEKKAQVVKSARTGRKTVVPAKKILVFEPEKKFSAQVENQEIQFEPDEEFRKQIGSLKSSSILLAVPSRDFFVKTIEYHFEKEGWKVNTAQSVQEAERFLNATKPHMVILDSDMKNHQALCEFLKCRKDTAQIPLIIMYPQSTDMKKISDFQICGNEYLIQPFELKHLIKVSESALRRASEENVSQQELLFRFPTTDKYLEKANALCAKLFEMSGLGAEQREEIKAAFREALANGAQHGNKHRRDKAMEVFYLLEKDKIIIAVTDNGFGFDWQKYVEGPGDAIGRARQTQREGRMGGLGIMLMQRCVDQLEYNDTGNVVTLTKYLK